MAHQEIAKQEERRGRSAGRDTEEVHPDRRTVEEAAYFRWLAHGGDAEENWFAAEAELCDRLPEA